MTKIMHKNIFLSNDTYIQCQSDIRCRGGVYPPEAARGLGMGDHPPLHPLPSREGRGVFEQGGELLNKEGKRVAGRGLIRLWRINPTPTKKSQT